MSRSKPAIRVARGVPSAVVHGAAIIVATLLTFMMISIPFWIVIALALGVLAGLAPRLNTAWALMVLLAFAALAHAPSLADWRPYALLAGIHLLHVLAALTRVVPVRGRLDARVLARAGIRFLAVQPPSQLILTLVLLVMGSAAPELPWLAPVGALALIALTATLVIPLIRRRESSALSRR